MKKSVHELVVTKIQTTSANRSPKDAGKVKSAIQSAERIFNPNPTQLFDLYDHITIDGHLGGVYNTLLASILNKTFYFQDDSGMIIEEMDHVIQSNVFRKIIQGIVEAKFYGLTAFEFVPGRSLEFNMIPRKHIRPKSKTIVINQSDEEGISYDGVSNIWVVDGEEGLGILSVCANYVIYKMYCLADWAQYIELFGQPIRIVKYDAHDSKTRMELKQVLDDSGSSLALMLPKQAEFEMLDGKDSNSDGELFLKLADYCDNQISITVLGNTETTKASNSSGQAQSTVHAEGQENKIKSYLMYVQNTLNSEKFRAVLRSYGLPSIGSFVFSKKEIGLKDLKIKAQIDEIVMKMRPILPVCHDYVYDTFGIRKPKNYEEIMNKRGLEAAKEKDRLNRQEALEEIDEVIEEIGLLYKIRSVFKALTKGSSKKS